MSEPYVSIRPCPVCGGEKGIMLAQLCYALFDDLEISGNKTLVQCQTCAMLYDDVDFSEEQLQEYYRRNEHYAVSCNGGTGSISPDNISRYDRIIDQIEPDLSGMIIDFGCGQGGFVSQCLKYGFKAVGIESSAKNREVARESGLRVYESIDKFVDQNPLCEIQAVVFSHVLEHVMYPTRILQILTKLAKDALLYIEVPDADSYLFPNAVRWQEMYFEHLSHFRKKNIAELAIRAGLEILKEGATSFSEAQKDVCCRFIVGRFTPKLQLTVVSDFSGYECDSLFQPPFISVEDILNNDQPLALWGVSQYAMLLIGQYPKILHRIQHLFDSSPSKIGRKIKDIRIEPTENLSFLTDDYILLIPMSHYSSQMHNQLSDIGFNGLVVDI